MAILIIDPAEAAQVRARHVVNGGTSDPRFTEMWEGVEVVPPLPNDEHQDLVMGLSAALFETVGLTGLGKVRPGVNVSDRADQWEHNYRGPDVVVYLATNPAVNHGTHWQGGPDFLVEVLSPGERPRDKFPFYAAVGVGEILLVSRLPWGLELLQLRDGGFAAAGRSEMPDHRTLTSGVLPLTFRLRPASPRPAIDITHTGTGETWAA